MPYDTHRGDRVVGCQFQSSGTGNGEDERPGNCKVPPARAPRQERFKPSPSVELRTLSRPYPKALSSWSHYCQAWSQNTFYEFWNLTALQQKTSKACPKKNCIRAPGYKRYMSILQPSTSRGTRRGKGLVNAETEMPEDWLQLGKTEDFPPPKWPDASCFC